MFPYKEKVIVFLNGFAMIYSLFIKGRHFWKKNPFINRSTNAEKSFFAALAV